MLTQFSFKNFKSYKSLTQIEMQAEPEDDFEETLLKVDNISERFLPVSVLYGPNGGGKTNAIEALISLITYVTNSINLLKYNKEVLKIKATPFEFEEKNDNIVQFEIYYIVNNYEYRYKLHIQEDNIVLESLYRILLTAKKPEKIFIREKDDINIGKILEKNKVNTIVNPQIPYLSFLAISYNLDVIKEAIEFFEKARFINIDSSDMIPEEFLELKSYRKIFLNILNAIDSCIVDFNIEKDEEIERYKIYTIHEVNNKKYRLSLDEESRGTIKIFSLLSPILDVLLNGGICIIDELDSRLHPKLLKFIIGLFKSDVNSNGAQLIFTSHDLVTMSNTVFRRDEILFAAKNEKEESELYSLFEIRDKNGKSVSKNSSYSKQYLEGRYGSDPYFKRIKNFSNKD